VSEKYKESSEKEIKVLKEKVKYDVGRETWNGKNMMGPAAGSL